MKQIVLAQPTSATLIWIHQSPNSLRRHSVTSLLWSESHAIHIYITKSAGSVPLWVHTGPGETKLHYLLDQSRRRQDGPCSPVFCKYRLLTTLSTGIGSGPASPRRANSDLTPMHAFGTPGTARATAAGAQVGCMESCIAWVSPTVGQPSAK